VHLKRAKWTESIARVGIVDCGSTGFRWEGKRMGLSDFDLRDLATDLAAARLVSGRAAA
jgi:hypothetical protein